MTTLRQYLDAPGAPRAIELAMKLGLNSDVQVRQWANGHVTPGHGYAMQLELATDGQVKRWTSRPNDWWVVWPDLLNDPTHPPVPDRNAKQEA